MDTTSQRIMDATISLIADKGYTATTTKDIAMKAKINESTIFRKFRCKKDIVMEAMKKDYWKPDFQTDLYPHIIWKLEHDLMMFLFYYLHKVTPDFIKLSIGLRTPQIYQDTAAYIMDVPDAFIVFLTTYFKEGYQKGLIQKQNFEQLAMTLFSATFGFTCLKASFGEAICAIPDDEYIRESVRVFIHGLNHT